MKGLTQEQWKNRQEDHKTDSGKIIFPIHRNSGEITKKTTKRGP